MAEPTNQKLARNLSQVKTLASVVTIENYASEIRPFLFGRSQAESSAPLQPGYEATSGIAKIAKNGVMSPSDDKIIITVAGKTAQEFKIANVRNQQFITDIQPDETGARKKRPSEYFFPSDLVCILTGLARIFVKAGYNVAELSQYTKGSTDNLDFVKEWAQVDSHPELKKIDSGYFYEERLERVHSQNIAQLLQAVIDAAIQYENRFSQPELAKFESQTEIEPKIITDIISQTFEKLLTNSTQYLKDQADFETRIKPILEKNSNFFKEKLREIETKEKLTEFIQNKSEFVSELFSQTNKKDWETLGSYHPETNRFLFTTRESDQLQGISQSNNYTETIKKLVETYLEKYKREIIQEVLLPLFAPAAQTAAPTQTEAAEETGGSEDIPEETQPSAEVSFEDLTRRLSQDLLQQLTAYFLDQYSDAAFQTFATNQNIEILRNQTFATYRYQIEQNYLQPVTESFQQTISSRMGTFALYQDDIQTLTALNLYQDNKFNSAIFESEWYTETVNKQLQAIQTLPNTPTEDNPATNYLEFLFNQYIAPAIQVLAETTPEQAEAEEDALVQKSPTEQPIEAQPQQTAELAAPAPTQTPVASAVVPTGIAQPPVGSAFATPVTLSAQERQELNISQLKRIQSETEWLYRTALIQIYTSQGKTPSAAEQSKLRGEIFAYLSDLSQTQETRFATLFASGSNRLLTLREFYLKQNYFVPTDGQQFDSLGFLKQKLKDDAQKDSIILTENIKNTMDGFLLSYDINQPYFTFDPDTNTVIERPGENPHDTLWFIENLSVERLALILNISPEELKRPENRLLVQNLKQILKEYALVRGAELKLHTKNKNTQKGLVVVSAADAALIKNGDEATIKKYVAEVTTNRDLSKKFGGETVAGAVKEKKGSSRKKDIQDEFKTFIPLWAHLSANEQGVIYIQLFGQKYYEAYIQKNPDALVTGFEFVPECIHIDLTNLSSIQKIAKDTQFSESKKQELARLLEINKQLSQEEDLARTFNSVYDSTSDPSEIIEFTEFYGYDPEYKGLSYEERIFADEYIQSGGNIEYVPSSFARGRGGAIPRFMDSKAGKGLRDRFGKRSKKKISPKEKSKQVANKVLSSGITKVAAGGVGLLIPGAGTAASAALMALKNKKIRDAVSYGVSVVLAVVIGRTIWALGSIGGAIGGVLGGVIGFATSGGAMILPGVVVGANVGEWVLPQRWDSLLSGRSATPASLAAPAAAAEALSQQPPPKPPLEKPSLISTTAGIGVASAGGFALIGFVVTIFVIFTIQSAFLIPVPNSRFTGGESGPPIFGSLGCFEFGPAGHEISVGDPPTTLTSIEWTQSDVSVLETAFATVAGNEMYMNLLCNDGPITVYRFPLSPQGYWGYVNSDGEIILYDGPFASVGRMEYLIIHETGHIIHRRNPQLVFSWITNKTDGSCYTYPFPDECAGTLRYVSESFSEGLTLYVTADRFIGNSQWRGPYPFQTRYPVEYDFFKNNVFGGQEF